MDTKGLYLGIDIDENVSQVCFYDEKSRSVKPVMGKDEDPYFQNAMSLSSIFENRETAPDRLASMTEALIAAAKCQTGEEKLRVLGVCIHDHSEEKREIWHEALNSLGIESDRYAYVPGRNICILCFQLRSGNLYKGSGAVRPERNGADRLLPAEDNLQRAYDTDGNR